MPVSDQVRIDRRWSIGNDAPYAKPLPKFLSVFGIVVNDSSERTHGGTARLIQTVFWVGDW
jgi:hypothetical protein